MITSQDMWTQYRDSMASLHEPILVHSHQQTESSFKVFAFQLPHSANHPLTIKPQPQLYPHHEAHTQCPYPPMPLRLSFLYTQTTRGIPTKGTTNPGGKKKETEKENRRKKK